MFTSEQERQIQAAWEQSGIAPEKKEDYIEPSLETKLALLRHFGIGVIVLAVAETEGEPRPVQGVTYLTDDGLETEILG